VFLGVEEVYETTDMSSHWPCLVCGPGTGLSVESASGMCAHNHELHICVSGSVGWLPEVWVSFPLSACDWCDPEMRGSWCSLGSLVFTQAGWLVRSDN